MHQINIDSRWLLAAHYFVLNSKLTKVPKFSLGQDLPGEATYNRFLNGSVSQHILLNDVLIFVRFLVARMIWKWRWVVTPVFVIFVHLFGGFLQPDAINEVIHKMLSINLL